MVMKQEEMRHTDTDAVFVAEDSTVGYQVLLVAAICIGGGLVWWWPGAIGELIAPWTRQNWSHGLALSYAMLVAVIGAIAVVIGSYLSDRGRSHEIKFQESTGLVSICERWRGLDIEFAFPLAIFSSFEVHQPRDRQQIWQLGVLLENQSYWRLYRDRDRQALEQKAAKFNERFDFEGMSDVDEVKKPERIEARRDGADLVVQWSPWERRWSRSFLSAATLLFALACLLPVWLVFDGAGLFFGAAIAAGLICFGIPLFVDNKRRVAWPFLAGWTVIVIASVVGLDAHWAYFPLATAGGAIFAKSSFDLVAGFWRQQTKTIRIDERGRIYDNGEVLEAAGQVVMAQQLEGALVNMSEVRPLPLHLVKPGGRRINRAQNLAAPIPDELVLHEPLELDTDGLSLFEVIWVALVIDDEIEGRKSG